MSTIYSGAAYRDYLQQRLVAIHGNNRGVLSAVAKTIGCQPSYLTQILKGKANLSLEQADSLNSFLAHDETESEYFLLMVEKERAGTSKLKQYFTKRMREVEVKHDNLSTKLKLSSNGSIDIQHQFFKAWHYSAIHTLTSIPEFQEPDAIARKLNLKITLVTSVLNELVELKLINRKNGHYTVSSTSLHLPHDAAMINNHHINWRLQAIEQLSHRGVDKDLFYTSVSSVSRADFIKLKSLLTETIRQSKDVIRNSKEELLLSFNIDLFER